jgi:hypothetical protein
MDIRWSGPGRDTRAPCQSEGELIYPRFLKERNNVD